MNRIQVPPLQVEWLAELEKLYQKTDKPRYRTRAQMVLLSIEQGLKAEEIAQIVRESHITVLRWLKRYLAEETGVRISSETVRRELVKEDIVRLM